MVFKAFLAYQMIDYPYLDSIRAGSLSSSSIFSSMTSSSPLSPITCSFSGGYIHQIISLKTIPMFSGRKADRGATYRPKLRCRVCKDPCNTFCLDCSNLERTPLETRRDICAIHGISGDKNCYYEHINTLKTV